jgi:hypothetical protein
MGGNTITGNVGTVVVDSQDVRIGPQTITPPEVIDALGQLASQATRSRNPAVEAALKDLDTELKSPEPSPSALQKLWKGVVKVLPDAAKVGASFKTLASFFS